MNARSNLPAILAGVPVLLASIVLVSSVGAGISTTVPGTPAHALGTVMLRSTVFVSSPPSGAVGPDDLTYLPGGCLEGSGATLWTAYQNGVNPDGSPGKVGGIDHSTVTGYSLLNGAVVQSINVTGKVDGLTAFPTYCNLIATINEDSNSSMAVIDAASGTVHAFAYSPSPTVGGNGGTDSIAIWNGGIYLSHSNPNDTSQATAYRAILSWSSHTAYLRPLYYDDSHAWDPISHAGVTLHLTDPDSNYVMPSEAGRFAGSLATISQADGAIVFASPSGTHHLHLTLLNVTDNVSGNVPPLDGIAAATSDRGTLYVVDSAAGRIYALSTNGWPAGTVFVGEPSDNHNPLVGTLSLSTGKITPFGNSFLSPKGLLFVPAPAHDRERGDAGSRGDSASWSFGESPFWAGRAGAD